MNPAPGAIAERFGVLAAHVGAADLERLARFLLPVEIAPGSTILVENEPANALYLLWEGELEVRVAGMGGEAIGRLGPGAILGDVSLIDGAPASATVVAATPASLLSIGRETLAELERAEPRIAAAVYQALCETLARRVRDASDRLEAVEDAAGTGVTDAPAPRHRLLDLFGALFGLRRD